MKCRTKAFVYGLALATTAMLGSAWAVPTIDGTADAEYGLALSTDGVSAPTVQNTNTQFGNAEFDDLIASGGGSEINQVFGTIANGRLYVTVAGNLERNFNKLNIFIDSVAGGASTIDSDIFTPGNNNVPFGLDPFSYAPSRGFEPPKGNNIDNGGILQSMDGMTFDPGFGADYALVFTHGGESVGDPNPLGFWAMSVHYADLTQGTAGAVVAAGIQLAPQGLPNVLRGPLGPDFNEDGDVDGGDFLTWQRGFATGTTKADGDANGDTFVDAADLTEWQTRIGTDPTLADFSYIPNNGSGPSTTVLLGPALPGLSQGELIDRNYALGAGGCADDTGAGCIAAELEFVLDVDPAEIGVLIPNASNHRNFNNTIGLEMALNNSNTAGVSGNSGLSGDYSDPTLEDPTVVTTGIEFSIPLSEIGNPTSDIRITAFINSNNGDYASNQFAGEGVLQGNLGGDGFGGWIGDFSGVDLSLIAGDQFVTVPGLPPAAAAVPEPSSIVMALAGVLACGLFSCRRG